MVSEFENIPLESVWGLGVIEFLNDLLYLKLKEQKDAKEYRKQTESLRR